MTTMANASTCIKNHTSTKTELLACPKLDERGHPVKYEKIEIYSADYKFECELPQYLELQRKVWGSEKTLSSLMSFTSGYDDPLLDALAISTKGYVERTWEKNGLDLLLATEESLEIRGRVEKDRKLNSVLCHPPPPS